MFPEPKAPNALLAVGMYRRRRRLERLAGLYENRGFACGGLISAQVPMDPLDNNIGGASVQSCDLRRAQDASGRVQRCFFGFGQSTYTPRAEWEVLSCNASRLSR
jgi:hypothetical protein